MHLRTPERVFERGFLFFPLELATIIGSPNESKKSFLLVEISRILVGGTPLISIIYANYSISFSPGNSGNPVYSSAKIHPELHISMAVVYGIPKTISGAL